MYKKIIVPLDGSKLSEQILPYARDLAATYEIPLELLWVNDPDLRPPFWPPLPGREYLKHVSAKFLPASLSSACIEERGKPAEVIVSRARGEADCVIAMATHGLSGIQRWLLGSVASKVIQSAANPVLLIRPAEGHDPAAEVRLKTIFVPLDGSGLAEKILTHVTELAKKLGLEVHLVRVYTLPPDTFIVGDGVYMDALGQQKEVMRKEVESYLEGKTQELRAEGLDRVISTAIEGNAAEEIIDLACRTPDNLIAMSTHGRSGFGRWVLGSVTEKVIHYSRDPVLVIRPQSGG